MKKTTLALIVTTIIALSTLGPALYIPSAQAADPDEWYRTVNGVLTTDGYELYPYEQKSIDFGLSKYGEMIDYIPSVEGISLGLQYPGYDSVGTYDQTEGTSTDAFATEYIDPHMWLNGWVMDVRYTHRTFSDRRVLSMAMFGDMATFGGDWIVGHGYDPDTGKTTYDLSYGPNGGRKTTGYAETEDLQVLYDGPRKWIGLSTTHIYDWRDGDHDGIVDHPTETIHIVDLKLTFIFNKVKKQVIILKDVKQVLSGKALESPIDVQLSNREEWDMGPRPDFSSYAHFYHQNFTTCYGWNETSNWHMADAILRENVETGYGLQEVPVRKGDYGGPIAGGSVRVYVNGEFMKEGEHYNINYTSGEIDWKIPMQEYGNDWVEVVYKLRKGIVISENQELYTKINGTAILIEDATYEDWAAFRGVPHLYDVAQMITSDKEYVGWKAFWPTLSDYTVDGWDQSLDPLVWVEDTDMVPTTDEPEIPFVIGEWDFQIGKEYPAMFRGVEVVGMTDYHDAMDEQLNGENVLDREVKYQLDEVFNPLDLEDAVHKTTKRWVEFGYPTWNGSTYVFTTTDRDYDVLQVSDEDWDQYNVFSERVINMDYGELLHRRADSPVVEAPDDYDVDYNADGTMTISGLSYNTYYKVLYSTGMSFTDMQAVATNAVNGVGVSAFTGWAMDQKAMYGSYPGRWEWGVVGRDSAAVDSAGLSLASAAIKNKGIEYGIAGLDMWGTMDTRQIPYVMSKVGTGDEKMDYMDDMGRAFLKDDWCTYWPVASSNIVGVGGPMANLYSYYVNDFTEAYLDEGRIETSTCWNKNMYASSENTGYAVVSTYLDINGTVNLVIWGYDGRDTYYATQWFHGDVARGIKPGIHQLQDAPDCLTTLVLEIDYSDPEHPTFSIPEALGTISEALWEHYYDKGGIHDP